MLFSLYLISSTAGVYRFPVHPGQVIRVSRGDLKAQLKALGPRKAAKPAKAADTPDARKVAHSAPPKRDKVDRVEAALARASAAERSYVVVIDTDPDMTTSAGGAWWDVAVPEVSERAEVRAARKEYESQVKKVRK